MRELELELELEAIPGERRDVSFPAARLANITGTKYLLYFTLTDSFEERD